MGYRAENVTAQMLLLNLYGGVSLSAYGKLLFQGKGTFAQKGAHKATFKGLKLIFSKTDTHNAENLMRAANCHIQALRHV